jgi:hypothetical protein
MRESAELAKRLIEESCAKQSMQRGQLRLHADRGTSMSFQAPRLLTGGLGSHKNP